MKFKFKEGQWFDVRKLKDWQKQWCLENLDFTNYSKNQFINNFVFKYRYRNSVFASTDDAYIQSNNELTFNDFYWEDEEVSQESIFDKPRWVTCCNDSLGQVTLGKDYKVVNVNNDNYTIIMDKGIEGSLHKDRFHKVTPQDLLPDENIESDEESFDNLVYVEPKHIDNDTYYVVEKDKLSENQWDFLLSNLPTEEECLGGELFLNLSPRTRKWFDEDEKSRSQDIYISFNDIFQEVE